VRIEKGKNSLGEGIVAEPGLPSRNDISDQKMRERKRGAGVPCGEESSLLTKNKARANSIGKGA